MTTAHGGERVGARVRVAYSVEGDVFGGVERHLVTVLHHLDRARYEPVVVGTGRAGAARRSWRTSTLSSSRCPRWHRSGTCARGVVVLGVVRRLHPQIFHGMQSHSFSGHYALASALLARVPRVVMTCHLPTAGVERPPGSLRGDPATRRRRADRTRPLGPGRVGPDGPTRAALRDRSQRDRDDPRSFPGPRPGRYSAWRRDAIVVGLPDAARAGEAGRPGRRPRSLAPRRDGGRCSATGPNASRLVELAKGATCSSPASDRTRRRWSRRSGRVRPSVSGGQPAAGRARGHGRRRARRRGEQRRHGRHGRGRANGPVGAGHAPKAWPMRCADCWTTRTWPSALAAAAADHVARRGQSGDHDASDRGALRGAPDEVSS